MDLVGNLQALVLLLLWVAVAGVVGVSLVDALRQPTEGFTAVGRLTKPVWLAILAVGALLTFLAFPFGIMSIFGIAAGVAGTVYLVDTRVKLRQLRGGGGSSSSGPYGPW